MSESLPQGTMKIKQADAVGQQRLYRERVRPQFHFTARRGWLNDPNGLVHYGGEYHLFFQHDPPDTSPHEMHWGHGLHPYDRTDGGKFWHPVIRREGASLVMRARRRFGDGRAAVSVAGDPHTGVRSIEEAAKAPCLDQGSGSPRRRV